MPIFSGVIASQITGRLNTWSPEGAYDALASVTIGSAVASISFTGIPNTYKHLQVRMHGRTGRTEYTIEDVNLVINEDVGANYSWHRLFTSPTVGAGTLISNSGSSANYVNSTAILGTNGAAAGVFGTGITDILDYASTTKHKSVRSLTGVDTNGQNLFSVEGFVELSSGTWLNTSPVTTLTWTNTTGGFFQQHTVFSLYGVK